MKTSKTQTSNICEDCKHEWHFVGISNYMDTGKFDWVNFGIIKLRRAIFLCWKCGYYSATELK